MLTDGDRYFLHICQRNVGGIHDAMEWYLRGMRPLPYQYAWHHFTTPNVYFVAGIATGKTTAVAASYLIDCISTPYFRALNTSVTAKQAELPFSMVNAWIEGNPKLEHHIDNISLRPYPVITFKNYSEYEFRTAGTDARFIRGFEYDRINFDEAGLDLTGSIIKVLRGRLRGTRTNGVRRMARLDVTTSPTEAPWLIENYRRGIKGEPNADLNLYRSIRVATWDNTILSKKQIDAMKAEYPPDMIDVEMGGEFPDYGLSMFPASHITSCVNQSLYDAAYEALNPDAGKSIPGYRLEEDPRHGITLFELPYIPGHIYIVAGDPGQGSYPGRNASVVIAVDVTNKDNMKLVYFHWINGKGSYNPFLQSFKYAIDKYYAILRGIDATGTQKGIDELAFGNHDIRTDQIRFNTDKPAALNMLIYDITNHRWAFAPIKGLIRQLSSYTLDNDKAGNPQDIVMTLAMASFLASYVQQEEGVVNQAEVQQVFYNRRARTTRNARR